jgi:hypothetical protein
MSEDELKKFILHYGDRVATRIWAQSFVDSGQEVDHTSCHDSALLQRLREKVAERKKKRLRSCGSGSIPETKQLRLQPNLSDDDFLPNASFTSRHKHQKAIKVQRRIELGWINFDNSSKLYLQVRINNGGGIRLETFAANSKMDEVLLKAKTLFFPDGLSSKGKVIDFLCDIRDYNHRPVGNTSVQELYHTWKVKLLRLFLATRLYRIDEVQLHIAS